MTWEASRRWPKRAGTPHWVVQRRTGAQFEYLLNDKGRTKRFRREDIARAAAADLRAQSPTQPADQKA